MKFTSCNLNNLIVDFITKLLVVAGKDTILVVCNMLFKITHFVIIIEGTLIKELASLFRDNMQKLHKLPKSVVSDRKLQFAANLTKELYNMLGIETKLLILFHLQTDGQTECMNQELEQYLQFFVNYRQKDWPEWSASAEFEMNNKAHLTTKVSLFIANYERKLRMGVDIRRKGKMEKVTEFAERMKKVQEEAGAALKRVQKEIKQQVDRERKKTEEWKVEDKLMLSTKDLAFKE